jgi:hypothetical protein
MFDASRTGGIIAVIDNGGDRFHPELIHQLRDGTTCL